MEIKYIVRAKQFFSLVSFFVIFWKLAVMQHETNLKLYFGCVIITLGVGFVWNEKLYDGLCTYHSNAVSYKTFEMMAMICSILIAILFITHIHSRIS